MHKFCPIIVSHHTGVVSVPGHQLRDGVQVVLQQLLPEVVEGDGGALRDHHHPTLVRQVEHLLGIWIVGGSETVGTQPFHQVLVSNCQWQIEPFPAHIGVFVLGHPMEVEGLVVDEQGGGGKSDLHSIKKIIVQ